MKIKNRKIVKRKTSDVRSERSEEKILTIHVSRFFFCLLIVASLFFTSCSSSSSKKDDDEKTTDEIPATETFLLEKGKLTSTLKTPGELIAFQQVDIYAKVNSFVKRLFVDVGSEVTEGQMLAVLEAPEITSQLSAAESKLKSQEAVFISSKATYDRLLETSKTPGTIAQNDLDMAIAKKIPIPHYWNLQKQIIKR